MRVLALDLSLTATGAVVLEVDTTLDTLGKIERHTTIKTPQRRKDQTTPDWNAVRFSYFYESLRSLMDVYKPERIITEVTEHAYQVVGGKKSSKGIEYRAGYGLGRAIGWLDGALTLYGYVRNRVLTYDEIAASQVKLRVAGSKSASKEAVKDGLATYFRLDTTGYTEAEVDALAVAAAWTRERAHDEKMALMERQIENAGHVLKRIGTLIS